MLLVRELYRMSERYGTCSMLDPKPLLNVLVIKFFDSKDLDNLIKDEKFLIDEIQNLCI